MCYQLNRHSHKYPPTAICALAVFLLLAHCGAQAEMISSSTPILAMLGEDILLPCHLQSGTDVSSLTLEWAGLDLNPRFVHVRRGGVEFLVDQNPSYFGRTSLSTEKLKQGDMSLTLSKVKLSDEGKYRCHIPDQGTSVVELVVGAVSSPVIIIKKIADQKLMLQCQSKGWYPEPEVMWMDSAGNLLPAGPTETLRGPDGLFTVSSKINVEKSQSNSFTCRVHQKIINQIRETGIQIQDDVFMTRSDCVVCVIVVSSVALLLSSAVFFVLWKLRPKKGDDKMHQDKEKEEDCEKVQKKEEEKNDMQQVIFILEEQKKELEITRKELILKLNKVEGEWIENEKKLKNVNSHFFFKDSTENSLLKLKMELENKKRDYKTFLESIEKALQKTKVVISKLEVRKKKVENQIDELTKDLNESNTQQVEVERGEDKTKLQKVENTEQQTKHNEMNPLLETEIELENEKKESKKPSDSTEKKEQESIEAISLQQEPETEPERSGEEQKSQQKEEEKEKGENKNKLQKVKDHFQGSKHDETKPESKIELENKKKEHKSLLDSSEKNTQESMDKISILEEQKTEPENSRAEQRPKQKKEKEKGEKKNKLKKVKDRFHRSKHDETKLESKTELENEKTECENLLKLEKNTHESMQQDEVKGEIQAEQLEPSVSTETHQQPTDLNATAKHF